MNAPVRHFRPSTFVCPPGMSDGIYDACVKWARLMEGAVYNDKPVPTDDVPLLYDMFRRVNPHAVDPVLGRSLQTRQLEIKLAREARGIYDAPADSSEVMPVSAMRLMLSATQSMLESAQEGARWQVETAIAAMGHSSGRGGPPNGYRRRNQNRRHQLDYAPYRPRPERVHFSRNRDEYPFNGAGHRRDDPPSYRRDRHPFRPTSPVAPPHDTPHPRAGFLFRGDPVDVDHVMRDETPFDARAPRPAAPVHDEANPIDLMTPAPDVVHPIDNLLGLRTPAPVINDSEAGTQGTITPRAPTPASVVENDGADREVFAFEPHAVMGAFPAQTRITVTAFPENTPAEPVAGPSSEPAQLPAAPANSEYAGSVTDEFEQLDLGAADQLLTEYLANNILGPLETAFKTV